MENCGSIELKSIIIDIESSNNILMKVLPNEITLKPGEEKKVIIYYQSPLNSDFIGKFTSYISVLSKEIYLFIINYIS